MKSYCYLAFVDSDEGPDHVIVKIGFSKNPASRFTEIAAMCWRVPSYMLATVGKNHTNGREMEALLHKELKRFRIHGEWFHVPTKQLANAVAFLEIKYGEEFEIIDVGNNLKISGMKFLEEHWPANLSSSQHDEIHDLYTKPEYRKNAFSSDWLHRPALHQPAVQ